MKTRKLFQKVYFSCFNLKIFASFCFKCPSNIEHMFFPPGGAASYSNDCGGTFRVCRQWHVSARAPGWVEARIVFIWKMFVHFKTFLIVLGSKWNSESSEQKPNPRSSRASESRSSSTTITRFYSERHVTSPLLLSVQTLTYLLLFYTW